VKIVVMVLLVESIPISLLADRRDSAPRCRTVLDA
jgi:hypothetical protein